MLDWFVWLWKKNFAETFYIFITYLEASWTLITQLIILKRIFFYRGSKCYILAQGFLTFTSKISSVVLLLLYEKQRRQWDTHTCICNWKTYLFHIVCYNIYFYFYLSFKCCVCRFVVFLNFYVFSFMYSRAISFRHRWSFHFLCFVSFNISLKWFFPRIF